MNKLPSSLVPKNGKPNSNILRQPLNALASSVVTLLGTIIFWTVEYLNASSLIVFKLLDKLIVNASTFSRAPFLKIVP